MSVIKGNGLWNTFVYVAKRISYIRLLGNTALVTFISLAGIILFGSAAGFILSYRKNRFTRILLYLFSAAILVPMQTIMISLIKEMSTLNLVGNLTGLIIQYWGFGIPAAVFLALT